VTSKDRLDEVIKLMKGAGFVCDRHNVVDAVKSLTSYRTIAETTLGSTHVFIKRGDIKKAVEWLETGIQKIDDLEL
jgi:hypothetical protein